jgi:hypothetical protein
MILTCVLESFDIESTNVIGIDGPRLNRLPSMTPHYSNEMKNISILILIICAKQFMCLINSNGKKVMVSFCCWTKLTNNFTS